MFDAAGRMTASIDQLGHRTTSTYDARGRRTAVTDPLGDTTTTTYDAADNAIAVTDPLGKTTTTTFDALNRPTVSTDPLGFRTTSTFDAVGNRLTLKDASNNTTTWTYDALDRVTAETDPLGNTATTSYDAVGRRASETDRLGRRRDYAYDAAGRRTTEAWYAVGGALAQTQTWTYDAANRMLTAQDPDGTYTFAYDDANRATAVQEPFGLVLTFGYDEAGNRTSVRDSKGGVTTVAFDELNRQTSESVAGTGVSAMRFDTAYTARSQVASVTRYSDVSGTSVVGTTAYQYDATGRTTSLLHTSAAGATLGAYTYAYDAADRLTAKTEGATTTYAYDAADQLTADGATTFGYDATGNRTNAGYATGTGNRLSTDGVWTYTHDANGNLTKRSKGAAAETWVYTYDHRNQMLTAAQSATDGGAATQRVTYAYDAFGVRIERQAWDGATTTTERYGVDGWDPAKPGAMANEAFDVWVDLDGSNAVAARYAWGTEFDALAARQTAAGAVQWALADRQGSVRLVTDSASVTQASASYTAFGGLTGTLLGGIGYTGQRHDAITGLISLGEGQRELDAGTGRLAQTDPGGFAASGPNLFTYVMNGPTNLVDPSGYQPIPAKLSGMQAPQDPMEIKRLRNMSAAGDLGAKIRDADARKEAALKQRAEDLYKANRANNVAIAVNDPQSRVSFRVSEPASVVTNIELELVIEADVGDGGKSRYRVKAKYVKNPEYEPYREWAARYAAEYTGYDRAVMALGGDRFRFNLIDPFDVGSRGQRRKLEADTDAVRDALLKAPGAPLEYAIAPTEVSGAFGVGTSPESIEQFLCLKESSERIDQWIDFAETYIPLYNTAAGLRKDIIAIDKLGDEIGDVERTLRLVGAIGKAGVSAADDLTILSGVKKGVSTVALHLVRKGRSTGAALWFTVLSPKQTIELDRYIASTTGHKRAFSQTAARQYDAMAGSGFYDKDSLKKFRESPLWEGYEKAPAAPLARGAGTKGTLTNPIEITPADLQRYRTEITQYKREIVLEKNKVYSTTDGTLYYTDAVGRVEKTQFTLKGPSDVQLGSGRTPNLKTTDYGNPRSGVAKDVGGHGRPDMAKGLGEYPNLHPTNTRLNNGPLKSVEYQYTLAAQNGTEVQVTVTNIWGPSSTNIRPSGIQIDVVANGESWSKVFANDASNPSLVGSADLKRLRRVLGLD